MGEKVSKNPTDTITSGGMLISFLTTRDGDELVADEADRINFENRLPAKPQHRSERHQIWHLQSDLEDPGIGKL